MSAVSTFDEALPIAPGAPEGPAAGGTEVIISGKNLGECSVIEPEGSAPLYPRGCENVLVCFGSEPGLVLAAEGENIAVFAPAHAPGTVDVTVTTPSGSTRAATRR